MDQYDLLETIGEGTYGHVIKAKHKESGQIVAIKKFKESDDQDEVRKTALREVRILKQLRHDNVVCLLDVFRRKRKLYLVFEYIKSTLLQELERRPEGMDPLDTKKIMWQLVRCIDYLHQHQVIHRDIKPENLLLSGTGVLKLCDFGFARTLSGPGARYTDYVSTRCATPAAAALPPIPSHLFPPLPPPSTLANLFTPPPPPPTSPQVVPLPRAAHW
jgi:cyclin-dependent kinase-like